MSVEFREDRKRWGFRVCRAGRRYARHRWLSKEEATEAYHRFMAELSTMPKTPKLSLEKVVGEFLMAAARRGRSHWRTDGLHYTFSGIILPFFGPATPINAVTKQQVESFYVAQKARGVKNNTIWHYRTDLNALYNWALREGLVIQNPVTLADASIIKHRKVVKPPLNVEAIERGATVLTGKDRTFYDLLRFTGMRMDEGNRVQRSDIDWQNKLILIRGTKTDEAMSWHPVPAALLDTLRAYLPTLPPSQELLFINRDRRQQYAHDAMFRLVTQRTGVKVTAKDLRDYYAMLVSESTNDPATVMKLLRHTSLATTTKYLRVVQDRLRTAVDTLDARVKMRNPAAASGWQPRGNSGGEKTGEQPVVSLELSARVSEQIIEEKVTGGGRNRTYDAADMSRKCVRESSEE